MKPTRPIRSPIERANSGYHAVLLATFIALAGQLASLAQTPPSVITEPTPEYQSLSLGATVTFRVRVSRDPPLSLQWRQDGRVLEGKTSAILNLVNVQVTDAGDYDVVVTNPLGAITSQVTRLDVDPTFTKIMSGPLVTDGKNGWGAAWGDYNGDGYLDVATVGGYWGGATVSDLYSNQGHGTFVQAVPNLPGSSTYGLAVNWADAGNDGDLDLWVGVNEASPPQYYVNQGDGTFTRLPAGTDWIENGGKVRGGLQAWADYDGDGLVDLVVVPVGETLATTGPISLLHNLGNGQFSVVTNSALYEVNKYTLAVSWVDFDHDDAPDLICGGESPAAFRNDHGTIVPVPQMDLPFFAERMGIFAWGDFANDMDLDLFICNGYHRAM